MVNIMQLRDCPLTGLPVVNGQAQWKKSLPDEYIQYKVDYEDKDHHIGLCPDLFGILTKYDPYYTSENFLKIQIELKEKLPLFFGGQSKVDFSGLFNKVIHWNCQFSGNNETNIKSFAEEAFRAGDYPKNRKERLRLIIKEIGSIQEYDGQEVGNMYYFKYWTKFYLGSAQQLDPYLKELENQGLINLIHRNVRLTFTGLDYLESLRVVDSNTNNNDHDDSYQVGLSFAGEDRKYVSEVAEILRNNHIKVFYDDYEKVNLWGKDLYQHLNDVYQNKCQYCIVFISSHYAKKLWTNHELKSAQTKAFEANHEYILPVRFDNTEIPGLNKTVSYLDATIETPQQIADRVMDKLKPGF